MEGVRSYAPSDFGKVPKGEKASSWYRLEKGFVGIVRWEQWLTLLEQK